MDASGKFVTPGSSTPTATSASTPPPAPSQSDGNEATNPVTAQVWAEHSFWPQDPQIPPPRGRRHGDAGAPGSANLIGGAASMLRSCRRGTVQGNEVPRRAVRAEDGLRRESQARVRQPRSGDPHGQRRRVPRGVDRAEAYRRRWDKWHRTTARATRRPRPRAGDAGRGAAGDMLVHNHCYRADEMAQMIESRREFGFRIRSFHHGSRRTRWPTCWRAATSRVDLGRLVGLQDGGVRRHTGERRAVQRRVREPIIHSDSSIGIQRLNQEAAKAM